MSGKGWPPMNIDILTLFPDAVTAYTGVKVSVDIVD